MQLKSKSGVEGERLFDLYSYSILDSEEEPEFNDIAKLITEICDTSISCVSFIDKDRHWLKAKVGFEPNEIERMCSFCHYTIENSLPNIVEDATLDERYSQNPFVINEPNIKFYAGFPLITAKGYCIGTISAVDPQIKKLNQTQIKSMTLLAKQVISLLEIRLQKITIDKSEKKYETLLNNLNEGFFIDDLDTKIVFANNKLLEIFGLNQKDVNHFNIEDYVSKEYLKETKNRHEKRINGEDVANTFEYIGKKKNGDKIWIRANVTKVIEGGKIVGTQTLLADITNEKKLIDTVDKKDEIISGYFNSTTDAICLVDENLKVKTFNSKYADTAYNLKNISAKVDDYIIDHISFSKKALFLECFTNCLNGQETRETHFMQYEKTAIWWDVKLIPLKSKDDKIIGVSYISKDITLEKELEIKNINYNNLLEGINLINSLLLQFDIRKNINQSICDMLVNIGGFSMAWIGWINEETKQIVPIAVYGDKHNFIKKNKLFLKDGEDGVWPISTSLKLNQTQVVNDALKNAQLHSVLEHRNEIDLKSTISVPIIINNTNRGALVVYSETENFFGHKEILSLESIVSNYIIAYERNEFKNLLLEKEYFISAIADNAPALISYFDKNLICKYVNQAIVNLIEKQPFQIIGKQFNAIYGEEIYLQFKDYIQNALQGNETEFEYTNKKIGKVDTVYSSKFVPHIISDTVVGIYSLSYDITTLKNQAKQLKKDANILQNIHDAILISDIDGNLIYYNSVAENIFGYTPEEVLGKEAFFIQNIEDGKNINSLFEEISKRLSSSNTWKAVTKKGATIWLKINSSPYYDENNEMVGIIGTCIDVTEQKNAEDELETTKLELNAILDNVPFSIFMKNLKGDYLFTNKAFKERTKTITSKITRASEIFSKTETIQIENSDAEVIKNKTNTFNNLIINGKEIFTIKFPVLNNKNKLIAIGGVAIDITDKLNQEKLIKELNGKFVKEQEQRQLVKIQSLLEGQEEERQRISRELHDGIGQTLSLCKLYASSLSEFKGSDDEKKKRIVEVNNSIKQAIGEIRTISANLMPSELNDYGLIVSLATLCTKINTSGKIKINLATNISNRFDNNLEIGIFRILQEIINNTLKHAFAKELTITIELVGTHVLIETKDNGEGFDTKKIINGNGLNNIKQRTKSLLGELQINSQPKKGCEFLITIPVS